MPALQRYLTVQAGFELEIVRNLVAAYLDIDRTLQTFESSQRVGEVIRRAQLREAQVAIHRQLRGLWDTVGDQVVQYRDIVAREAVSSLYDDLGPSLRRAGLNDVQIDQMIRSQQQTAVKGVETAITRIQKSKIPLSERVWRSGELVNGRLDQIINTALAKGSSAKEIADAVRGFVNPNTPGGVRYAASRLGRTELNNAFHASQVQAAIDNPWVVGCQWHNSESHPEPDECDELAEADDFGLGPGMYPPEEVPEKPHPQCLCYMTNETPSPEEFINMMADKHGWSGEEILEAGTGLASGKRIAEENITGLFNWEGRKKPGGTTSPGRVAEFYSKTPPGTALQFYQGNGYRDINNYLRGSSNYAGDASRMAGLVSEIDNELAQRSSTVKSNITLYRGIQGYDGLVGATEGGYLTEASYSSASTSWDVAQEFGSRGGWMMEISVPKGQKLYAPPADKGFGSNEYEILMARNSKYRITEIDLDHRLLKAVLE